MSDDVSFKCLFISLNLPISEYMLIAQAKIFGKRIGISELEFHYLYGWLRNLKKRYGICQRTIFGEAKSADYDVENKFIK